MFSYLEMKRTFQEDDVVSKGVRQIHFQIFPNSRIIMYGIAWQFVKKFTTPSRNCQNVANVTF